MNIPTSVNLKCLPITLKQSPNADAKHWNSVIKHEAKLKNDKAVLFAYTHIQSLGVLPDPTALPLVLKACGNLNAVEMGINIHSDILGTCLINDVRVGTSLVHFYCKCGRLEEAFQVFDNMPKRDAVAWNAIVSGCVECTDYEGALLLCEEMQRSGLGPNARTMVSLLQATGELMDLRLGKQVHGYCLRNRFSESSAHVATALIGFYLKFDLILAHCLFKSLGLRSVVSWNAMIKGVFEAGNIFEALDLFLQLLVNGLVADLVTILVMIQACGEYGCLKLGMQVHQLAIKYGFCQDLYILSGLMTMYSDIGFVNLAHILFQSRPTEDVALWNSLMHAYIERGNTYEAVNLFRTMRLWDTRLDQRTICIALSLCADMVNGVRNGHSLQAHAIKCGMSENACIRSTLLSLFNELNCIEDSWKIFNQTIFGDVPSWNSMILMLGRNRLRNQALELFMQMGNSYVIPNSHTIISILSACDGEPFLKVGRSIHGYAIKVSIRIDPPLHSALTEMYLNCNDESAAKDLFESFKEKDLISWNAMIASYVDNNKAQKALLLFHQLIVEMEPNAVTVINALSSCTSISHLPEGQCLHAFAIRRSLLSDLGVANAFMTMYARCGSLKYAENIFLALQERNVVSWNAMIASYGVHGRGYDALDTFSNMLGDGFTPDRITFISVLSACSHSGFIEKGLHLYHLMIKDFKIMPEPVHYACVVDLLARGGRLEQAWEFINSMPVSPDASAWRSLLGACREYSETKPAWTIFEKLIELEPTNAGNYVLLSNVLAAAGRWSEVERLRKLLHEKGLKKPPGKSWIAIRNEIHYFTAGDKSHPQCSRIYEKLNSLLSSIREIGYVPELSWVLHDEEDEKKLARLFSHSEKLAIAFGLINTRGNSRILITKNLRICGDCHEFSKNVSKLTGREIVVRDGLRFHHFSKGICSCRDFW